MDYKALHYNYFVQQTNCSAVSESAKRPKCCTMPLKCTKTLGIFFIMHFCWLVLYCLDAFDNTILDFNVDRNKAVMCEF